MNNLLQKSQASYRRNRAASAVRAALIGLAFVHGATLPENRAEDGSGDLYEPVGMLLTWQSDPTRTMTIDWHTLPGEHLPRPPSILYREEGSEGDWQKVPGTFHAFPFTSRTVKRVELTGLEPGTSYSFRIGPDAGAFPKSRTYSFRTMPSDLSEPIRFAAGGDTGRSRERFGGMNEVAVEQDIEFIALGGDLAYADGGHRDHRVELGTTKAWWESWFDVVKETLITEEGRVIPILAGIGNHEVWRGYVTSHPEYEATDEWRERMAPIYYNVFAFTGQPGYAAIDFSDYLSLIFLDSHHTNRVEGKQTEWLERVLEERRDVPHVFPIYHVASFPAHRDFDRPRKVSIREHWVPLFEENGLKVVFENHDHTYKRTPPIRDGRIDPDGVVYLGDGNWGFTGREHHDVDETWYLEHAEPTQHFYLVTLDSEGSRFEAINIDGEVFDRYPEGD